MTEQILESKLRSDNETQPDTTESLVNDIIALNKQIEYIGSHALPDPDIAKEVKNLPKDQDQASEANASNANLSTENLNTINVETTPITTKLSSTDKEKIDKNERPNQKINYREKFSASRKHISEKIGRYISNKTFDRNNIKIDAYNESNPEKYPQDYNFATYEQNLRESHYQDQKETREYHMDKMKYITHRMGSVAMLLPGMNIIGESITDAIGSRQRQKARRKSYKERNGTFTSKLRKQYNEHKLRFDTQKSELADTKERLAGRQKLEKKNSQ